MSRARQDYLPIQTHARVQRRRHHCAVCGCHAVHRDKVVTYTCPDPAWQITRGPHPFGMYAEWPWRATHTPTDAIALARTQRELSTLLGRLQTEILACRQCLQPMIFYRSSTGTLHNINRCEAAAWAMVPIARCIHCGEALIFHERTFAQEVRRHTHESHGGYLYGGPDHYRGDGTLRREYWEKHFVFEPPPQESGQ